MKLGRGAGEALTRARRKAIASALGLVALWLAAVFSRREGVGSTPGT